MYHPHINKTKMNFRAVFDDESNIDMPDWHVGSIELDGKSTCMDLSAHGKILAIGFNNGVVEIMDSESEGGDNKILEFDGNVVEVSFSRDGKSLCACNKSILKVADIATGEVKYENAFSDKILSCKFSKIDPNLVFVLISSAEDNLARIDITTKEIKPVKGHFTCFNLLKDDTILGGEKADLHFIKPPYDGDGNDDVHDTEIRRGIVGIEPSHNGKIVALLDRNGVCVIYNPETNTKKVKKDPMNGNPYTTVVFDRNDEKLIVGTNKMSENAFTSYEIDSSSMRQSQGGPKDSVLQLYFHPLYPFIFVRTAKYIHIWKPVYRDRWAHSVPEFNNIAANEQYEEPEDEFDEGHESGRKEPPRHLQDPIDIFTKDEFYPLSDDKNYPDQSVILPVKIDDIKQRSSDDEEESGDESSSD